MRELARLTQAAAAEGLGVDPQTISRWERGERQIAPAELQRVKQWYQSVVKADEVARQYLERHAPNPIDAADSLAPILPADVGDNTRRFQADAARMGATNEELDVIHQLFTDPRTVRILTVADNGRTLDPESRAREFTMLAEAILGWLNARIAQRSPHTAPIATGFKPMSSRELASQAKKTKRKRA
jgi:transcriptional regulator with XRE-family HTH domain